MKKEYLLELRKKITELSEEETKLRNIYLRDLAIGKIQGPKTGYRSIDKDWLSYYSEEALKINYPKMTMYEYMMNKNRNYMDDVALRYFNKNITYKKFDNEINKAVRSFKRLGVKKGDRVTICMPNTPEAVISVYALNKMGAVAAMMHPKSAQNEIKDFVNEMNSKVVVMLDKFMPTLNNIINETNIKNVVVVSPSDSMPQPIKLGYRLKFKDTLYKTNGNKYLNWQEFKKLSKNDKFEVESEPYEKDRLAVILRTGGTTGRSKGVKLSDDNFNTMVEQFFQSEDNFHRGDKLLAMMPVFHGFGLCSSIHLPLSVGVNVNLIPELQKKQLGKLLKEENHIIGVPTFLDAILKNEETLKIKDLSNLKYIVSGGDADTDKTEEEFNKFLKERNCDAVLRKGYGLAEMVAGATFASGDYNEIGSIGIPMAGTDFKLVKEGTDIEISNDNEVGEMCFRGPSVMMGYDNAEEETNAALKDGWLHTGDLAVYRDGLLYFKQRKGDMIINSGINVYPREIERVLIEHEAIENVTVIGVYHPYKKQVPKAYIKLKEGYTVSDDLINEFKKLCKKNLNIYSNPYDYEFIKDVPQTLLGKVNRKELSKKEETEILRKYATDNLKQPEVEKTLVKIK